MSVVGETSSEVIPDAVLLDTAPFQSALHVFASVGGLALLAEHLPLLYPEVTRQVTPPEVTREVGSSSAGIGHDWVTLEANEDMYEVSLYEVSFNSLNVAVVWDILQLHKQMYCSVVLQTGTVKKYSKVFVFNNQENISVRINGSGINYVWNYLSLNCVNTFWFDFLQIFLVS